HPARRSGAGSRRRRHSAVPDRRHVILLVVCVRGNTRFVGGQSWLQPPFSLDFSQVRPVHAESCENLGTDETVPRRAATFQETACCPTPRGQFRLSPWFSPRPRCFAIFL